MNVGELIAFKLTIDGQAIVRKVCFWEQVGNYTVPTVRHAGKKEILMDDGNGGWLINNDKNRSDKYSGFFARKSLTS